MATALSVTPAGDIGWPCPARGEEIDQDAPMLPGAAIPVCWNVTPVSYWMWR